MFELGDALNVVVDIISRGDSMTRKIGLMLSLIIMTFMTAACQGTSNEVVVYTSVDRVYSEPIFDAFYEETGIKVLAVYDVEANKTTGLVQRLIQEKDQAKADVFWNGEMVQMLRLKNEGVLASYASPNSVDYDPRFVDKAYEWTAFGGRARILLVNNDVLPEDQWPTSWQDLSQDAASMNVGLAKPMFGTTATHVAGLYSLYGRQVVKEAYGKMLDEGVKVVDGNGAVRDMVVSGALAYGFTDTDDALAAIRKGANVTIIFPDQGVDESGTMIIPNSLALIEGGPNLDQGQRFIDYMLSDATITALMDSGWFQMMLAEGAWVDEDLEAFLPESGTIKVMDVLYTDVVEAFETSNQDMIELFLD